MTDRCSKDPESVIVDVGANIGTYVLNFRRITAAHIVAFEPNPESYALLARNVNANELENVELRNVACGSSSGTLTFQPHINGHVTVGKRGPQDTEDTTRDRSLRCPLFDLTMSCGSEATSASLRSTAKALSTKLSQAP